MKKKLLLFLLLPFLGFSQVVPPRDYIISSSNTQNTYPNFKTITSAINYLNDNGINSNVRLLLEDSSYDLSKGEEFPITIKQYKGSDKYTLTIKPNVGKTVSVEASTSGYNNPIAVFKLDGADNIIFDGSNSTNGISKDLTLYNTNPNTNNGIARAVIWIASLSATDGANNNIIKNIILRQFNKAEVQNVGIFAGGTANVTDPALAANSNTTVTNVQFTKVGAAIYVNGSSNSMLLSSNWVVSGNIIGSTSTDNSLKPYVAVNFTNVKDYTVSGNIIDGLTNDINRDYAGTHSAIWIDGVSSGSIFNNKIANISSKVGNKTPDSRGIYINSSNNLIYNNFISGITSTASYSKADGIYVHSGSGNKLYYNTIVMSNNALPSSCLYINGGTTLDVRNNIFNNTQTGGTPYAVYSSVASTAFTHINFNNYYAKNIGFLGSPQPTLENWKTATGKDANSINVLPSFISTTDLHLQDGVNSLLKAGVPISSITKDIDGDLRDTTTPYIGADELCKPPVAVIELAKSQICSGSDALFTIKGAPGGIVTFSLTGMGTQSVVLSDMGEYKIAVPGATQDQVLNINLVKNGNCENKSVITSTVYVGRVSEWNGTTWTYGLPLDNGLNALISSNLSTTPTLNIIACNCTVSTGKTLTINNNSYVKIKNNLTNNGTVVIKDGGNLIQENDNAVNSGKITVEKSFTFANKQNLKQFNYVISPVKDQVLKTIYPGNPTAQYHVEGSNYFGNSSGAYIAGRALALQESGSGVVTGVFNGEPFNGWLEYELAYTTSNANVAHGYNLIGNPFPSNLDLEVLYNERDKGGISNSSKIDATFQFWDNRGNLEWKQLGSGYTGDSYAKYNVLSETGIAAGGTKAPMAPDLLRIPNQFVKVGTGFMIRAKSTANGQKLIFNNHMRTSERGKGFTGKTNQKDRYWLTLKNPSDLLYTSAVVYFDAGNNEIGPEDSGASSTTEGIYTMIGDSKLSIHGRSAFTIADKVEIGASFFKSEEYIIAVSGPQGVFANGQAIYLKDKFTGIITNLSEGTYKFSAVAGQSIGRFEIVYKPEAVLATDGATDREDVVIYRDGSDFVVKAKSKKISELELYDFAGRLIKTVRPNTTYISFEAAELVNGAYMVKIQQGNHTTVKKIIK